MVCRGCSEPLQRAIVDFGADAPAARIPQKLKEHYGIEVSASTCWSIVLQHAQTIDECPKAAARIPERDGVEQLIGEIDGSMIPVGNGDSIVIGCRHHGSQPRGDTISH